MDLWCTCAPTWTSGSSGGAWSLEEWLTCCILKPPGQTAQLSRPHAQPFAQALTDSAMCVCLAQALGVPAAGFFMGEPAGFLSTTAFCKGTPAIRLGMLDALPRLCRLSPDSLLMSKTPASLALFRGALFLAGGDLEVSLLLMPCTGFSVALPSAASPKIACIRARTLGCVFSPVFKFFHFLTSHFFTSWMQFGLALLQPFAGSKTIISPDSFSNLFLGRHLKRFFALHRLAQGQRSSFGGHKSPGVPSQ